MVKGFQITIESGPQAGAKYRFPVPSSCVVGRGSDCDVAVIGTPDPLSVSRKQCRFDVTPNGVRLLDLGSRNGTSLNGELIGMRFCSELPDHDWWTSAGRTVDDGNEIAFAGITMRVHVDVEEYDWTPTELAAIESSRATFPCRELSW